MFKGLVVFLSFFTLIFAADSYEEQNIADCVVLKDQNSIICKYMQQRDSVDKKILFEWSDPDGNISRTREMIIPAGHGSVYDFRYIDGRKKGIWTFKVFDDKTTYETTFELK